MLTLPMALHLALVVPLANSPQDAPRPNVILIVTDDQGVAAGCYGDPDIHTPNMDRLAAEGVIFENAFCTTASCSPSRSVLLTGEHNHSNGQYGLAHSAHHFIGRDGVRSFPAVMSEAGYHTARVGKYHVLPEKNFPFDEVIAAGARNPVNMARKCKHLFDLESEEPFFLYFCTSDPHRGGGVAGDLPGTPDRFGNKERKGVESAPFELDSLQLPAWLPDTLQARAEWAQFLESVERVDQGLGQLMQFLEASPAADNTLVIFTSDHGPAFPGAKTTVYDPGLRVALIAKGPGVHADGRKIAACVSLLDFAPTLADFCDLERSSRWQGRSFAGWLSGPDPEDWTDEVFASHTFHEVTMYYPMRVLRTSQYKLIWNIAHPLEFPFASDLWGSSTWQRTLSDGPDAEYGPRTVQAFLWRPEFELYDLQADPLEVTNLATRGEHTEILSSMQDRLREWMGKTRDP